jgi:hypothetical protein
MHSLTVEARDAALAWLVGRGLSLTAYGPGGAAPSPGPRPC